MIEDDIYPGMFRLVLPDGGLTIPYNLTRAKEFRRRMNEGENWMEVRIGYEKIE